jgi:hypothetical protein
MPSVSITMNPKLSFIVFLLLVFFTASAQENSPYSRYGLGDTYPSQNIINRSMGGIGSTYANGQSVNLSNPAAYSELKIVTYDIGISLDTRSLKSADPVLKYNSVNLAPSYVALGMPLSKAHNIGLAFGLKPLTKVSYSIQQNLRLPADSMQYLYEGDGGLYQAFIGIGKRWGGLRLGVNTGYMFGRKENNTTTIPIDSVSTYKSNAQTLTTFNKIFLNAGLQYDAKLSKTTTLRLGLAGNLKQKLNAQQQINTQTINYDANGAIVKIDSVYQPAEQKGSIQLPVSYSAGISLNSSVIDHLGNKFDKSLIAVEYESTKWADYRFFNQTDKLINSWQFKVGGQLTPNPLSIKSYWNRVTYRAGFYYGKEAVNADGNELPVYGLTLGTGLPIRKWRSFDNQYTIINTSIEIGKRGNNKNNITESFFRVSLGLNLSDIWFIKRKYE